MTLRRFLLSTCYVLLFACAPPAHAACTNTANLSLCKPAFGDTNWHTNLNSNSDILDAVFGSTTGHAHTGVAGQGPKIDVTTGLSVDIATQAELDAHAAAADPHTVYLLKAGGTMTGATLIPNGTKAAPALALSFDSDAGWYSDGSTTTAWIYSAGNEDTCAMRGGSGSGVNCEKDWGWGWTSTGSPVATPDTEMWRDSAGLIALRGKSQTSNVRGGTDASPNPYGLTVYNYNDPATPAYERLYLGFSSDVAYLETQKNGTGADDNPLHIRSEGGLFFGDSASRWQIDATTHAFLPAVTDSYALGSGSRSGSANLDPSYVYARQAVINTTDNGSEFALKWKSELTTIAASATTDTTITIPADSIVCAVSVRVTVVIPTAATFDIGVAGATTRYGAGISTAATTTSTGTLDACRYYSAATAIRITPNLTPADNTGRVRVSIHYLELTPADS